jgi:serine/threonine-protein kinase PknG
LPPRQALARVRAGQGDDTTAMRLYADVLKADPGNIEAILGMTTTLLNLQRWDEVARVLSGVSEVAAKYIEAQLMLCDLFLNRMTPLTPQNVLRAAQAVHALSGRTEDSRYYLARGDVYRAARQLARAKQLPTTMSLPGLPDTSERSLSLAAEESYTQYLRAAQNPPNREEIVRRRFEVAPWRLW